jgi:hypothetical protein
MEVEPIAHEEYMRNMHMTHIFHHYIIKHWVTKNRDIDEVMYLSRMELSTSWDNYNFSYLEEEIEFRSKEKHMHTNLQVTLKDNIK